MQIITIEDMHKSAWKKRNVIWKVLSAAPLQYLNSKTFVGKEAVAEPIACHYVYTLKEARAQPQPAGRAGGMPASRRACLATLRRRTTAVKALKIPIW